MIKQCNAYIIMPQRILGRERIKINHNVFFVQVCLLYKRITPTHLLFWLNSNVKTNKQKMPQ